jgi:outer membrane protein OmpA-like peptidoglycan-associated protein
MPMTLLALLDRLSRGAWLTALALAIAGCAAPKATNVSDELPFEEAVAKATDGLVTQTQTLPAFLQKVESKLNKKSVVLDPMLDSTTGQQTAATVLLENRVSERLATQYEEAFEILPFRAASLSRAQYLLTGTMTRAPADRSKRGLLINLALTDLKTGQVVAQASAIAKDEGLDNTPLAYYRDSPVLVKDKVIDGYVATSATAPGQKADAYYMERIAAATVINEATTLYNQERYQEALGQYRSALATPAGEQMRALNGIYLTNAKLGRTAEAEQAFGRVVAFGIASNQLGVKFLFNPGSTDFWSDPKVSGAYQMWLRQIAKESTAAKACMNIIGHTSHTGSEQTNDALSLQRASFIRQRLATESSALGARTKVSGMGFRENIVGSGTDNAVDALDRRVEFKIVPCT